MGAAPRLSDISVEEDHTGDVSWFNKQIALLLNRNRLSEGIEISVNCWIFNNFFFFFMLAVLPSLLDDVNGRMELWGKSGKFDPFKNIYDVRAVLHLSHLP